MRDQQEREVNEVATFLNSVPLLNSLTREEKLRLLDGLEERSYQPGEKIITQVRRPAWRGMSSDRCAAQLEGDIISQVRRSAWAERPSLRGTSSARCAAAIPLSLFKRTVNSKMVQQGSDERCLSRTS